MIPSVIIGAQWGDEGKGKIVDYLAKESDFIVRFNGGNNAGHTVVYEGKKFPLSLLPSGILWKKKLVIAQGVVLNPRVMLDEIDYFSNLGNKPNLIIDSRVNIVMPYHQILDAATEESKGDRKVGSLKLGIGYCYEDRNNRQGIRLEDLINPKILKEKIYEIFPKKKKRIEAVFNYKVFTTADKIFREYKIYGFKLRKYMGDVSKIIYDNIKRKNILFEGAHGTFLDANFGSYPYTTAVNTIAGSVFSDVGIPAQKLMVIGVVKAYTTRVGSGPFPSELVDNIGMHLQKRGNEFGTVSKRKRRCGWLDFSMLRVANRLNGFDSLAITKVDVLTGLNELKIVDYYLYNSKKIYEFPSSIKELGKLKPVYLKFPGWRQDLSGIKKFSNLPVNCRKYLMAIEKCLKIPIKYISVGAERNSIITN